MRFLYLLLVILIFFSACKEDTSSNTEKSNHSTPAKALDLFSITYPSLMDTLHIGDSLLIEVKAKQAGIDIDSIQVSYTGHKSVYASKQVKVKMDVAQVGVQEILVLAFCSDGTQQKKVIKQYFLSDIAPKQLSYTVVNKLKHNSKHYTQGLEIFDGFLYEGVGNYGRSAIYKKQLREMGELQEVKLAANRFGEGITIFKNRIYQLTYRARELYIYDFKSLNMLQKISYPMNVQGWGLTHNDEHLIMSSGEPKLYFMDHIHFDKIKEIHICDDKSPTVMLNELEYVNGFVYANIWMEHKIAKIELSTGRVVAYLDLTQLVPSHLRNDNDNVLNGIAYNAETDTYFVTGKRWAVMYEIKIKK